MLGSGEYYLIGLVLLVLVFLFVEWRKSHPQKPGVYDLIDMARLFVTAAEQMMPGQTGSQKLSWVMACLTQAGLFTHIDPIIVRAAIEAGVLTLKRSGSANDTSSR